MILLKSSLFIISLADAVCLKNTEKRGNVLGQSYTLVLFLPAESDELGLRDGDSDVDGSVLL